MNTAHSEKKVLSGYILFVIAMVLTAFRFLISTYLGVHWYLSQYYDDRLMIHYAMLDKHFSQPDYMSLAKTMMFPLFLNISQRTGLTYPVFLTFFWVLAAMLTVLLFRRLVRNRFFSFFVYLFVLYNPIAFESWLGQRLYRNAMMTPFVLICFALMSSLLLDTVLNHSVAWRKVIANSILLAVFLPFTYYIKEDGAWLLAVALFFYAAEIFLLVLGLLRSEKIISLETFRRSKAKKHSKVTKLDRMMKHHEASERSEESEKKNWFLNRFTDSGLGKHAEHSTPGHFQSRLAGTLVTILVLAIPFASFLAVTKAYKAVNEHYFGVAEVNTRTEGELGEFVKKVYVIDSPYRNREIWTPYDAIEQVFDASPTLASLPGLREELVLDGWEETNTQRIRGEFLHWNLRNALNDLGLWTSEKDMNDLFHQVNLELDQAFKDGRLQKADRIQLVSGVGGRTPDEIKRLLHPTLAMCKKITFLSEYSLDQPMLNENGDGEIDWETELTEYASELTHEHLDNYQFINLPYAQHEKGNQWARAVLAIYKVLNPLLVVLSLAGIILYLILCVIRHPRSGRFTNFLVLLFCPGYGAIMAVYEFALVWYGDYIDDWYTLFFDSMPGFAAFTYAVLFGMALLVLGIKSVIRKVYSGDIPS